MIPTTGRFGRSDRLRDSRDYRRVSRRGQRRSSDAFVVLRARRSDATTDSRSGEKPGRNPRDRGSVPGSTRARIGITASRKVGNAVVRNRIKRRVRAWYRRHRDGLRPDEDIVVIARKPASLLGGHEIDALLCRMLGLSGVEASEQTNSRRAERSE